MQPTFNSIRYKSGLIQIKTIGNEEKVQYFVLDEGPLCAKSVQAAKVAITQRLREHEGFPVLSIDAWRDTEGGWTWNDVFKTDVMFPAELIDASPRKILAWCREDLLADQSKGKVAVEDVNDVITIVKRSDSRPLYAIELYSIR